MSETIIATEKLAHPAIVEAVCEFRFGKGISYTMIPGAMSERLRAKFPSFEVLPTASLLGGFPDEGMMPQVPHHRFRSQQPNALVQTGPRLLTVNMLPVYPGFETFRDLILYVLRQYREVAQSGNPLTVGLRYINHIVSPSAEPTLGKYLKCEISYPNELPHPPSEVSSRLALHYAELGTLGLVVGFPSQNARGEIGALLDLDFSWGELKGFDLDRFPDWLDRAHGIIYSAFTATVLEQIMTQMRGTQHD